MFYKFQIVSLYGTGDMGLRRPKIIKTPQKNFSPWPPKTCWVFFATFFKRFRFAVLFATSCCFVDLDLIELCVQNEFSAAFCSLSTGRWIKPLFCSKIVFSLPDITNTRLRQQRMCRQKPCLRCLTCWPAAASVVRGIAKIAMKSQNILSRANQLWLNFFCKYAYRLYLVNVHCLCTS